jgi:hypothetical protein
MPARDASSNDKQSLSDRVLGALLKPGAPSPVTPQGTAELEHESRYATDKERLIGLIAAPLAAAIGFAITSALISHDPAAPSKLHVSVSLYHEVLIALLALSVLMMVTAWFRKRLYLGIVLALFGLTVFNLHYWGFGVPFLMFGAWMMVTAYRINKSLKEATGDGSAASGSLARGASAPPGSKPRPSRRYTPPTS